MLTLAADSINQLFASSCEAVLQEGRCVAPRGLPTKEVLGAWLCLTRPRHRLLDVPPARVINPAFAAAELVWIVSGSDDGWIFEFNRQLLTYTDAGRLQGAYGPRLRRWSGTVDQLRYVVETLDGDPDSRQAVVQLFDPGRDHRGHKDVPCTLGWRFYVRDGHLHMHTTMRSQDLWLGFPYDLFTFTVIHELVAHWLGVEVGEYHHHVDSLHLYERDVAAAQEVPHSAGTDGAAMRGTAMGPLGVSWADLPHLLSQLSAPDPADMPSGSREDARVPIPAAWLDIAQVMASYRRWKRGDRPGARALLAGSTGELGLALGRWYGRLSAARHLPEQAAPVASPDGVVQ